MATTNSYHLLLGAVLSFIKAFWSASVQLAWGISSFFLLRLLIAQTDYSDMVRIDDAFFRIIVFMQQRWFIIFCVIAIYEFAVNFKEFIKPIKVIVNAPTSTTKKKEIKL